MTFNKTYVIFKTFQEKYTTIEYKYDDATWKDIPGSFQINAKHMTFSYKNPQDSKCPFGELQTILFY